MGAIESTLEEATEIENSKGFQKDFTNAAIKAPEGTKAGRESIKTTISKRALSSQRGKIVTSTVFFQSESDTYNQAMKSVKHVEWKEAADTELALLEESRT